MLNSVSVLPLTCCEDLVSSFLSGSVPWAGMGGLEILLLEPVACQSSRVHCEDLVKIWKTMTWTCTVWKDIHESGVSLWVGLCAHRDGLVAL